MHTKINIWKQRPHTMIKSYIWRITVFHKKRKMKIYSVPYVVTMGIGLAGLPQSSLLKDHVYWQVPIYFSLKITKLLTAVKTLVSTSTATINRNHLKVLFNKHNILQCLYTQNHAHIHTELSKDLSPDVWETAELIAHHKMLITLIRYMKRNFSHWANNLTKDSWS